jgi:heme/copper-type cytochrome/quinol oxidase subunit 1
VAHAGRCLPPLCAGAGGFFISAIGVYIHTLWLIYIGYGLVNYIREYNVTHGVPKAQAYNVTMYIMAGLLVVGFLCNLFVKAVHHRFHMKPEGDTALATAAEAGAALAAALTTKPTRA